MTSIAERTRSFVGLRSLIDACQCRSVVGRQTRDGAPAFAAEVALGQINRARALEEVVETEPGAGVSIESALLRVPDCAGPLDQLASGTRLSEADLFRIQQMLVAAVGLASVLCDVPAWKPPCEPRPLVGVLDPRERGRGFTIDDAHQPGLGDARRELTQTTALRLSARASLRERWERELSLRADRSGRFAIRPAPAAAALVAAHGERLRLVQSTAFEAIVEPVPTEEIEALDREVENRQAAVEALEGLALDHLTSTLRGHEADLRGLYAWVGEIDFAHARVELRQRWAGCWPRFGAGIEIVGGRLPALDNAVPIDVRMSEGLTVLVGPNMGGKTSVLRLVATCATLGAMGFPVPANSALVDVFDTIDASMDDGRQAPGLSAFGTEAVTLRDLLARGGRCLLVVDEPARGTNPVEGTALTEALCATLATRPGVALVATHFTIESGPGSKRLRIAGLSPTLDHAGMRSDDAGDWREALARAMDYRVIDDDGSDVPRDALRIARLLGLPPALVDDAAARIAARTRVCRSDP